MKFTPGRQKGSHNLELLSVPVGSFACNCYILYDRATHRAVIIDPGDDACYLENIIADHELMPEIILATHGHLDHVGAVLELQLAYHSLFAMSHKDSFLCKQKINVDLDRVKKIHDLEIVKTPGHTPGSVSLYYPENNICFVGDLIFKGNLRGRTDWYYSDPLTLEKSISKLRKLGENIIYYPGHGSKIGGVIA